MTDDEFNKLDFRLNVFHMYGHGIKCQLEYSPRVHGGEGLMDGESPERVWSGVTYTSC
jgi:Kyakuja-Dileera-Zisupton transposase